MNIINSESSDIDVLFNLYDAATLYQKKVFGRSWQGFDRDRVQLEIEAKKQWKIVINEEIACVFCIEFNDPYIWLEKDKDPAIYIHRIATNPTFRGQGMVKEIVNWAKNYAIEKDKKYIRMDTGSGNERLNNYYKSCGFTYMGASDLKDRSSLPEHYRTGSFTLFEIDLELEELRQLPPNLPTPVDDGACNHLLGMELPNLRLGATNGESITLHDSTERVVLYCYPMTSASDMPLPEGWDSIPGARGCTPQSCSFRNHYHELREINTTVYGMSTQTIVELKEEKERIHLPFELLSDTDLQWSNALQLPTFEIDGIVYLKRVTLIIEHGRIVKYFYPIFPPDQNGDEVIAWIKEHLQAQNSYALEP